MTPNLLRGRPTGKSPTHPVQPLPKKYSCSHLTQITLMSPAIPSRKRSVSRSSRTLVRDAMDVEVPLTNGAKADGKDVWS